MMKCGGVVCGGVVCGTMVLVQNKAQLCNEAVSFPENIKQK